MALRYCLALALAADLLHVGGRELLLSTPPSPPSRGAAALVIVLHGGLGNAERIESARSESGLSLDAVASRNGFYVAYLNGTPVTRFNDRMLGWNAGGGCCGQAAANNVDDVGYIRNAIDDLASRYGIDRSRVYGVGHSNGAMMTARIMCETTLYAAAVTISGPLNLPAATCPGARGRRILAIHGADDENVPVAGGRGTKGLSRASYNSEDHAKQVFTNSGASYELDIVKGADHALDRIDAAMRRSEGVSIADRVARFFNLTAPSR